MGCCISSRSSNNPTKAQPQPQDPHFLNRALVPESDTPDLRPPISGKSPAPPPLPLVEEETVKEVLSETPTPKPPPPPPTTIFPKLQQEEQQKFLKTVPSFPKIQEQEQEQAKKNTHFAKPLEEEISEESELYSLTESAVSTSAVTDRRDDDGGEVTQRVVVETTPSKKIPRKRSTSGDSAAGRGGKSPARRSPARKPGREVGQTARRRILPQNGNGRDSGENSCRRSRSPGRTRMEGDGSGRPAGGCRSPMRVQRSSPGRIPASSAESRRRVVEEDDESREENWVTKESLEDPLVSLECFIFL